VSRVNTTGHRHRIITKYFNIILQTTGTYDKIMATSFYNQNEGGRFNSKFGDNKRERDDKAPFSRLFVVCGKQHTSDDLREAFRDYGSIEDIWVVKDRNTKENRGIAYIQYSKMSEACMAIENLNGKKISDDDSGPALKVIMAQPRSGQAKADLEDETALTRLFVIVPRGKEESDLREAFSEFGDIDYVQVVKDRNTGEKKGFGYIKYHRAYDAAKALEDADKSFKAVMAEPKSSKIKREMNSNDMGGGMQGGMQGRQGSMVSNIGSMGSNLDWGFSGSRAGADLSASMQQLPAFGFDDGRPAAIGNRLQVNCAFGVTGDQLARLFDLIPGMELCDLKRNFSTGESKGVAVVVYNSVGSATYAKEKLHGFEYPPGFKLSVRYSPDGQGDLPLPSNDMGGLGNNLAPMGNIASNGTGSFCNVDLPPAKPTVKSDEVAERLFIVCQPAPPPPNVLVDVFSRFGDLIDVFTLRDKNFGYAKFASVESAEKAMEVLHGAEVCGAKLKVLTAEPPKTAESARKRPRT